ncbi:ATP-dependent DNA helicase RecG [Draconibacterium orientale]|uniref:ATP-dependent DNA helicase RecG n=2 Tax=Draconibacterium orientale TaxID=1168034 RepID=A0A1I0JWF2_9BACT|nr:ATP-dependent DNA helicase RecG [Draconibacterium orientale]
MYYPVNFYRTLMIWNDKIEILSFPGPIPPDDDNILKEYKRIVARDYRNRRIGDFLKELRLTEGRGTGFPTIYNAMENNNSPSPGFDTDKHSTYFLTTLPAFISDQVSDQVSDQISAIVDETIHSRVSDILNLFLTAKKRTELFEELGLTNHSKNRKRYLDPLIDYGWVKMLYTETKTSPKQMYLTTDTGKRLLKLLISND